MAFTTIPLSRDPSGDHHGPLLATGLSKIEQWVADL
jgi:hypothetical protein